jgi:hypothetical protein
MALLELEGERASAAAWPDCCARCASAGTRLVPVPAKYAKGVDGLTVPLCEAHADDWNTVRSRNRVGSVAILLGMAAVGYATWELYPRFAGPNAQNAIDRGVTSFFFGFLTVLPLGALLGWWAKTPIRVFGREGRTLTLAGVCGRFAAAARESTAPPPLPVPADAARFEVGDYRPAPTCPAGAALKAVLIATVVGAIFGWVVGTVGRVVAEETAGWGRNDWRHLGLVAAAAAVYLVPVLSFRFLFKRVGIVLLGFVVALVVAAVLVLRLFGLPLQHGFATVLAGGPLLLLYALVVSPVVWRWRIRSGFVAAIVGAVGPLAFLGLVSLTAGAHPGPQKAAYSLGALALISMPFAARAVARTPYCAACDAWLEARRLGSFPRPAGEVRPALASGAVVALAGLTPSDTRAPVGDSEVKVHACPDCRERGTVVVELFDCRGGGRGGKSPALIRVGRWSYPGTALLVIETMFPPPKEPDEPAPAPDPKGAA